VVKPIEEQDIAGQDIEQSQATGAGESGEGRETIEANAEVLADFLRSTRGMIKQNRLVNTDLAKAERGELALVVSETQARLRDHISVKKEDLSLEYKLGKIILDGLNRDIGFIHAIKALVRFFRQDYKASRRESRLRRLGLLANETSPADTIRTLRKYKMDVVKEAIARIKVLRGPEPVQAGEYARLIKDEEMAAYEQKFVGFSLYDAGDVRSAASLLELVDDTKFNDMEMVRVRRVVSEKEFLDRPVDDVIVALVNQLAHLVAERAASAPVDHLKVAYVAASSLPMNRVGYTTRTQKLVAEIDAAAKRAGGGLEVVTRPGYPFDRFDLTETDVSDELVSEVDSIRYHHLGSETGMQDSLIEFHREAAAALADFFLENGVRSVIAASNHVNAMPAFIAARAIGIPFTYEVRGLWEETAAAKRPGWADGERYAVERKLESYLIANADHTFFITRQVKELFFPVDGEAVKPGTYSQFAGGADAAGLAPNCASLDPATRNTLPQYSSEPKDVLTLTYIGSLTEYEGLQLVLQALAGDEELKRKFKLNIVGGGVYAKELRTLAQHLRLNDVVHFAGRVEPDEVASWFDSADIVIVPRLPFRVCQLVSPLKPLEAMSSNRVCLASNVAPIADLITDSETGFLFEAGNIDSLKKTLRRVHNAQSQFGEIGSAAYDYVAEHRTWKKLAIDLYRTNTEASKERAARANIRI
jgi:glycosyltransferase involved in cell wall biosynthesis